MLHAENSILCIFAHCPFNNLSKAITTRSRPPYLIISFPMPSVAELKFRKFRKLPRLFVRERRRAKSGKRQKLSFQGAKNRGSAGKIYLKLKFRWQSISLQRTKLLQSISYIPYLTWQINCQTYRKYVEYSWQEEYLWKFFEPFESCILLA